MVEVKQSVEMYHSYDEYFDKKEITDLNDKLVELEINCEVIQQQNDDGETLIFRKRD